MRRRKQYKSLDPSARARYLAKLLVLGPKEADDPFAAWNDISLRTDESSVTR